MILRVKPEPCDYNFDATGELYVQPEHITVLHAGDVDIEGTTIFVEMSPLEYAEDVPEGFPERSTVEDEVEVLRDWSNYAPFKQDLANGNFLVRCVHVSPGAPSGNGLSAEQFKIWYGYFTNRIKTCAEITHLEFKSDILEETDII